MIVRERGLKLPRGGSSTTPPRSDSQDSPLIVPQSESLPVYVDGKDDRQWTKLPTVSIPDGKVNGDQKYLDLIDTLRELHLKKAADYGDGYEPLANLRAAVDLGIEPWVGCMLRLNDKMTRVHSLIRNGSLANESIEDNLMDMASYALLALRLYKEGQE